MEQHIYEVMYHLNDTDLKLISSDKLNSKGMVVKPRNITRMVCVWCD